jgi:hypothetical protein
MARDYGAYKLYVDMSGTLKKTEDDIYIGCILVNDRYRRAFREKFYRDFPSLQSFTKKGSGLKEDKLKEIIQCMQDNHIKMSVVILPRHIIKKAKRRVQEKLKERKRLTGEVHVRLFEEKLLGLAYYHALCPHAFPTYHYDVFCCAETQLDIHHCFAALTRIAYVRGRHFRPAATARRVEHMLKFADFTASAVRKVDRFVLDQYPHLTIINYDPADDELDLVFGLTRHADSQRNIYKDGKDLT